MSRRILVPLDTSPVAEVVLPYVEELTRGPDDEVVLLTVSEPEGKKVEHLLQEYLKRMTGSLRVKGASVRHEVAFGEAAESILDYAERAGADLIAMASHGLSGITRWVRGSTAEKVLRHATLPVFLVQAQADERRRRWTARRILMPLDGSQTAECVFDCVQKVFEPQRTELVLINVVEPPRPPSQEATPAWEDYSNYVMSRLRVVAQRYLTKSGTAFREGGWNVSQEILQGDPASIIVDFAGRRNIDAVILATCGFSPMGPWVYGAVTSKLLEGLTLPVLLTNPACLPSQS